MSANSFGSHLWLPQALADVFHLATRVVGVVLGALTLHATNSSLAALLGGTLIGAQFGLASMHTLRNSKVLTARAEGLEAVRRDGSRELVLWTELRAVEGWTYLLFNGCVTVHFQRSNGERGAFTCWERTSAREVTAFVERCALRTAQAQRLEEPYAELSSLADSAVARSYQRAAILDCSAAVILALLVHPSWSAPIAALACPGTLWLLASSRFPWRRRSYRLHAGKVEDRSARGTTITEQIPSRLDAWLKAQAVVLPGQVGRSETADQPETRQQ
jgi:hypothetical protein